MIAQEKSLTYHVPALEKGLDILEVLSSASVPLSLTEISKALDRRTSELFRMVDCLEKRGFIVKELHSGNYYLSLKLYELAHTHSPIEQMLKAAAIPMRKLAMTVRESCHMSVLRNGKLVVLTQEESREKVRLSVEVGGGFSPIHTTSGRLLLAHIPKSELSAFLMEDPDYLQMDEKERQTLEEKLIDIRSKGYSFAENESHVGIRDIAVLVGNPDIGLCAALAVASLIHAKNNSDTRKILQALKDCAKQITELMGVSIL